MLVPKLRFKREDGTDYPEWEEKKMSELFNISAGGDVDKSNSSSEQSDEYPYAIYANALTNNGLYGYANYYKVEQDCFTVTGRGDIGYAVSRHEKFVPVVRLLVCVPKHNENVDCFAEIVNNTSILVESTGVPQLTSIQLEKIRIVYPTHLEEQQKIADFLSTVDEVIAQSEKEVQNLEQQKKAAMQKIFLQEIRFKHEDGTDYPEWAIESLRNLCDYTDYRGKTPKKTNSGIFLVTAKNIKQGYIDYDTSREYIDESDYITVMHRGFPQIGDVLITTEAPCGNVAQIDREKIALAQRVIKYRGKKERLSNDYLCFALQSDYFQDELDKKSTGGTVKGIKGSILHTLCIYVPCLEEQQKIADFLSAFDEAISYAKQELEKWKELKKGLLQQIFV